MSLNLTYVLIGCVIGCATTSNEKKAQSADAPSSEGAEIAAAQSRLDGPRVCAARGKYTATGQRK